MHQSRIPSNIEAEKALLGSLLIMPEEYSNVVFLQPQDFFDFPHQQIYRAMQELHDRQVAIDEITVAHELAEMHQLQKSGGCAYLSEMVSCVASPYHAKHYAKIVKDMSDRRKSIQGAAKQAQGAYEGKPKGGVDIRLS